MTHVKSVSNGVDATGLAFTRYNEWDANNNATRASVFPGGRRRSNSYRDIRDAKRPSQESCLSGFESAHATYPSRSYDNGRGRTLSSHMRDPYHDPSKCSSARSEVNCPMMKPTLNWHSRSANRTDYRKTLSLTSCPAQYPNHVAHDASNKHIDALKLALSKIGRPHYQNSNRCSQSPSIADNEPSTMMMLSTDTVVAPQIVSEHIPVEAVLNDDDREWRLPVANEMCPVFDRSLHPFMTGIAFKKSRFGIFGRDQRRYLVLRQTCLEIYNDEASYTLGSARSCILLIGAKLELVDGNLIKIDSCGKQRQFGIESQEEIIQWVHGIHRVVSQFAADRSLV